MTEEVIKQSKAYNELRREIGNLTKEEEERLNQSDKVIKGIEDGIYVWNELNEYGEKISIFG